MIDFDFIDEFLTDLADTQKTPLSAKKNIDEFIRLNPETQNDQFVVRMDGVVEWTCEHGVGHPITGGIHGCDGCCLSKKLMKTPIKE